MSAELERVGEGPFPIHYERARMEIAAAASLDECAQWTSQAAALASYARQAKDDSLLAAATRIKARAVRRSGEILRELPATAHGGGSNKRGVAPPPPLASERAAAGKAAGLSTDQILQAVRVAKVPAIEFEKAVEAVKPPSIERLAERGTQKKASVVPVACTTETCGPPSMRDKVFHVSSLVYGFEAVKGYDLDPIVGSCTKKGLREMAAKIDVATTFLSALDDSIQRRLK